MSDSRPSDFAGVVKGVASWAKCQTVLELITSPFANVNDVMILKNMDREDDRAPRVPTTIARFE